MSDVSELDHSIYNRDTAWLTDLWTVMFSLESINCKGHGGFETDKYVNEGKACHNPMQVWEGMYKLVFMLSRHDVESYHRLWID